MSLTDRLEREYARYARLCQAKDALLRQIALARLKGPGPGADENWARLIDALAGLEAQRHLVDVAIRGPKTRPELGLEHRALQERLDGDMRVAEEIAGRIARSRESATAPA